jgi:molybdopterin-guanine dinucleotide biosynthesis protein A
MGTSKALLPFGAEVMLQRMVRLLGEAVSPLVVVAAADQPLPTLPADVKIARDRHEEVGPLEGLAAGWHALPSEVEAVYATGCDVPLLVPAVVTRLIDLLGDDWIAVPQDEGFCHPLSAVYRREVLPVMEQMLAEGHPRLMSLLDRVPTRQVAANELRDVDPHLATLQNCNHPNDYRQALLAAGLNE